jgi:regulation of enolase protein 1 (concanavalin A-like superfamily)
MRSVRLLWSFAFGFAVYGTSLGAFAVTVGDDFTVNHDYLANGVSGTIWDGIYTSAGSFPGGNTGAGPGSTLLADANITGAGRLTVRSVYTGWENTDDDGFFLFKNVAGDFQMSVHVVSPFSNTPYNFAGLLVRAASAGGSPFNGAENHLSITRVDEFGVGNWIRNTTNGSSIQMTQPSDANYWLRIDRVNGATFNFYQKALDSDPWQLIANSTVERSDFAGLTLQVGIEQASYIGNTNQAQFDTFRLTIVPEPAPTALICAAVAVATSFRRFAKRMP